MNPRLMTDLNICTAQLCEQLLARGRRVRVVCPWCSRSYNHITSSVSSNMGETGARPATCRIRSDFSKHHEIVSRENWKWRRRRLWWRQWFIIINCIYSAQQGLSVWGSVLGFVLRTQSDVMAYYFAPFSTLVLKIL